MKKTLVSSMIIASIVLPATPGYAVSHSEQKVMNIAHRGASGYAPENTLAAYDQAVAMNADYFEIDLQLTKDGHLVSIHDTTLARTTNGHGFVGATTLSKIKALDAGSYFDPKFSNEKVPTFDEILKRYKGARTGILVEVKSPELYPGIENKIKSALEQYHLTNGANNKIIIQSFNHDYIKKSKALLPNIKHGVLVSAASLKTSDAHLKAFRRYADYYNPSYKLINKDLVDRAHRIGLKVEPYTIRNQEQIAPLMAAGVDGIITDYPDYMYPYKKKTN
ncbi:glycerophosphodiester phosphodiesterase [Macrococcoides caseolyticum]|uniref:glycerophosphodiester phosphodiesterase n=1 Tax=Macrococcoides caseolyticum TaxID=69966 RepID=UPI001F46FD82|nr:glycerophosphodiester phosphodiesterase family protein [Macrococcus caseolyticus]MCE4956347.1 glycerophosphodiester phosphodiesterase [Macrococcus caseolyticus]